MLDSGLKASVMFLFLIILPMWGFAQNPPSVERQRSGRILLLTRGERADDTAMRKNLFLCSRIFFIDDSRLVPDAHTRIGELPFEIPASFFLVIKNLHEFFSHLIQKKDCVARTL